MGASIVPKLTKDFHTSKDNQGIQFSYTEGSSIELLELLKEEKIDLSFTSMIDSFESIQFEPIFDQELVLIVPENHPLAHHDFLKLKSIEPYPLVYFSKKSGLRPFLDEVFQSKEIKPKIELELVEDHTLLGFVQNNYGVAILPRIPSIASYKVKIIDIEDIEVARKIYLATRKNAFQAPNLERFIQYIKSHSHY